MDYMYISSCVYYVMSFETSLTLFIFEHLNITLIKCIDIDAQVYFSIQQQLTALACLFHIRSEHWTYTVSTEHIVHSTKYCDRHYRYIYDVDEVEFSSLLKIEMFSGFWYGERSAVWSVSSVGGSSSIKYIKHLFWHCIKWLLYFNGSITCYEWRFRFVWNIKIPSSSARRSSFICTRDSFHLEICFMSQTIFSLWQKINFILCEMCTMCDVYHMQYAVCYSPTSWSFESSYCQHQLYTR